MTQLNNCDLLIMKGDNLLPEQRKKTGQRGHHRSASQTKGVRIRDRAHRKKCGWTTSASINKRHTLPRAQIGESGRSPVDTVSRNVSCGRTRCKFCSLRLLLKFCSSSRSSGINFCTVERVLTMHRFQKSALLYCYNL
ncbi:hypothetical protein C1H46_004770 [Malus baccata]|uniref:Uncharacterized protein n=1 Tax=Malus baccata TaxID=106549 RepID=A0A540NEV6_MALBA|nr:hypothetical protein C1H46_004770 [Malus baccata]